MKKVVLILLGAVSFLGMQSLNAQTGSRGFNIKATITANTNIEGKTVYLTRGVDRNTPIDSTVIKDGEFTFKGQVAMEELYYAIIMASDTPSQPGYPLFQPVIPVFVENTDIEVSGLLDSIPTESIFFTGNAYNYKFVKITGSKSNDAYRAFLKGYDDLNKQRGQRFTDYIVYLNPEDGEEKGSISTGVQIAAAFDQADLARTAYVKKYIMDNPQNPVSTFVAWDKMGLFSVTEIDQIMGSISAKILATAFGSTLKDRASTVKKTTIGAQYADFEFTDDKGNKVRFSDILGKGKYVMIDFWASWCGPCRADLPHLKEVYNLYHPSGFEVISVSMDDNKQQWLKAVKEEKMPWLQVSNLKAFSGALSKLYNFDGIPTCILVDPEGKIVTRNMRGSWMDKKLIELYGNKFGDKY